MKNLKKIRLERKLTQEELADYINVSKSTYSRYESGTTEPDMDTLNKLADFFNVSVDYLLGREESSIERLEKNLARLDPRIQQAYHSLQNMDEEDLAMTLELIKVIESKNKKG